MSTSPASDGESAAAFLDNLPDGFFILDAEGYFLEANPASRDTSSRPTRPCSSCCSKPTTPCWADT